MTGRGKLAIIGGRLFQAVPALIGIIIVTFLLTRALPGDPAAIMLGVNAREDTLAALRQQACASVEQAMRGGASS
mgnify:CR=1 FL=1